MIELHILGTASARPTSSRSVSGSVFACPEGLVVIDAGEGFQMRYSRQRSRMKKEGEPSTLRPNRIVAIALTHGHLDHTWGLLPFLQTLSLDGRQQPLTVYGPTSTSILDILETEGIDARLPEGTASAELLNQYRAWFGLGGTSSNLGYELRWLLGDPKSNRWVEFCEDASNLVWHDAMPQPEAFTSFQMDAIPTQHSVPSCAWQLSRKKRKGSFDREISMVVSGDTAEQSIQPVAPVTVLIHEATFLDNASEKADAHLHSTASGAARTAMNCNAQHLILTHFSARLRDVQEALSEAKEVLGNSCGLETANDGDRVRIDEDGYATFLKASASGWVQHNLSHH